MGNTLPTQTTERGQYCYCGQNIQISGYCLCEEKQLHRIVILPSLDSGYARYDSYDTLLQCSFIGPPKAGKTLLSSTLTHGDINRRNDSYTSTYDITRCSLIIQYLNEKIKLQCVDFMSDTRLRSKYWSCRSALTLLFCDLNNPDEVIEWLNCTYKYQIFDEDDKVFLVCDTSLSANNNNIKQLQTDIMIKCPLVNIIDSFIFDYCKQQEFIDTLEKMFKHISHTKLHNH